MISITRRYPFSASHRLHIPALSEEQNMELFGKCANPYGHGHNFAVEVTVRGELNPRTGRVIDLTAMDHLVDASLIQPMNRRDLNRDIPEFSGELVPTTENLISVMLARLQSVWPENFPQLQRVRIYETRKNTFEISNL